ncbi:ISA1083-3 transposase [Methanohalobium evestigatum Z-7303]|uniref:ISA1083-3 transposase n=2 Tax=Methanohalobium evestigatum (strain ATCC BAA-1072 / DSM 3721 / NBRC 107634 / OCM 161 / Z-7303) TaxID=644295 RepID=D7E8K5_METEZ|nr:ISA1083-3 transposase [Methanohalobium evestigatum Z-7303]
MRNYSLIRSSLYSNSIYLLMKQRRKDQIDIEHHVTLDQLNTLIKTETNARMLRRLYFCKFRYLGDSVSEAADKVGITKMTGYYWQDRWNKGGYEALVPMVSKGREHKLTQQQFDELKDILKERSLWTTNEVRQLVIQKYGVEYSLKQIRIIMIQFGMKHSKPYTYDYRKPENADEILKKPRRHTYSLKH